VTPRDGGQPRDLVLQSRYQPTHTVTLVGTANPPSGASVAEALERVRLAQQPAAAAPAPAASGQASPSAAGSPSATSSPPTFPTPNGPRTLAEIRDELARAGWGGGSDQDALATYNRVAGAAKAAGH
jgi:hypothetical protein